MTKPQLLATLTCWTNYLGLSIKIDHGQLIAKSIRKLIVCTNIVWIMKPTWSIGWKRRVTNYVDTLQVYTCIHAVDRWRRCPNPHLPPLPNFYIYPLPHSRKFRMGFPSTRTIKVASSSLTFRMRFPLHPYQRHFSYRCPVMSSTPYSNYTIFQQLSIVSPLPFP